ncbi:lysylphosphatidylglycerol synthase transmembrane domain-containing protein [Haladaptatus sp. DYSN1]|uniref:lysylphosphatidylglycerol synthase transmembrane domain-containing protein n=1 Tax=unclassified Haladaptatus TaxID=2622732 RepID=UPI0024050DE9|nr:lysylphosphatidylglycerol synthase transmembrane domain-containing protein [Haladaptatus sp. DYSN1]
MGLDADVRTIALGFLSAIVVLAVVFWLVGIDAILAALSTANPPILVGVLVSGAVWIVAWGLALWTVVTVLNGPMNAFHGVMLYSAAIFANNITPFGQAGGEPFSALLISRTTKTNYETGLAAIASVDALNFVPSIGLGLIAVGYFLTTATVGGRLEIAVTAVGVLAVAVPVAGFLLWQKRDAVKRRAVGALTPTARIIARVLPRVKPPERESIIRRIDTFFASLERVAASRRTMAQALGFSALGWLALATSLWFALLSLGHAVPYPVVLLVIPLGSVASITPLPGGLGGVEAVLVGLLVPVTSLDPATAGAAVILHRLGTYWLPTVLGGGMTAVIANRT